MLRKNKVKILEGSELLEGSNLICWYNESYPFPLPHLFFLSPILPQPLTGPKENKEMRQRNTKLLAIPLVKQD